MRFARLPRSALGLLALLATGLAGPATPIAQAQATAPQEGAALTRLSSCINDSGHLLVLFLIDESGSLKQTDPSGQRVTAAQVALAGLESVARTSRVAVDVQFAGFSVDYDPVGGWTPLTAESLPQLQNGLNVFRSRNQGQDTDYFVALRGAQHQFADRTAQLSSQAEASPCKALLWFTDGKYDIEDRRAGSKGTTKDYASDINLAHKGGGAELVARGREMLCQKDPLVDSLRTDDVVTLVLALAAQIAPADKAFLGAIAQGSDSGTTCGQEGSASTGELLDAADLGELVSAFDRAASEIGRGAPVTGGEAVPVCATAPCPQGRRTFRLDNGLQRFHLLARTGGDGIQVVLEGPAGGTPLTMKPSDSGTGRVGDVTVRWAWVTPQVLTVDGEQPASGKGWEGQWTVTFVDPTGRKDRVARSQIYLFSDLVPHLAGPTEFVAGNTNELRVEIVSEADDKATRTVPGAQLELLVGADQAAGGTKVETGNAGPDGRFTGRYTLPESTNAASLTVTMRLMVPTSSGVRLAPSVRTVELPVRVAGLPAIRLEKDHLSAIKEKGKTSATLVATGDPTASGCVWLVGSKTTKAPSSAGDVKVTSDADSQSHCLKVAAGVTRNVTVQIDPQGSGNGTLQGVLTVAATSDKQPQPRERTLSYSVPMSRPISKAKEAGVALGLIIAGFLIPLLLAYGANYWSARFQPIGALRGALIPITATSLGLNRLEEHGGRPLALEFDDFGNVPPSQRRQRRFSYKGFDFRGRIGRTPFGGSWGEATRPGWFCAGSATRCTSARGRAARLGLALPSQWVLSLAEGGGADGKWELLVFAEPTADLARLTGVVSRAVPDVVEVLKGHRERWLKEQVPKEPGGVKVPVGGTSSVWPDEGNRTGGSQPGPVPGGGPKDSPSGDEPPW